jgi:hypothetical protein
MGTNEKPAIGWYQPEDIHQLAADIDEYKEVFYPSGYEGRLNDQETRIKSIEADIQNKKTEHIQDFLHQAIDFYEENTDLAGYSQLGKTLLCRLYYAIDFVKHGKIKTN